jgi:hypothetical protein
LATSLSGLAGLGLDEKIDEEQNGKNGSEKNGKVGTALNLKRNRFGWKGLNNRIKSECRSRDSGDREGSNTGLHNIGDYSENNGVCEDVKCAQLQQDGRDSLDLNEAKKHQ